jgi:hypothetical protein
MKERNYFREVVGIFAIILVIQSILFSYFHKPGLILVFGLIIYFFFFIYKDREIRKDELNNILHHEKSWKGYDRKLPEFIP